MSYNNTSDNTNQVINEEIAREILLADPNFDWKGKKVKTLKLDDIYRQAGYEEYAIRAKTCATWITYKISSYADVDKRVKGANYCNLRLCPLCSSRKAKKAASRLSNALRLCEKAHPGCQFIFLTLTIKNVSMGELSKAITQLTSAWYRFMQQRKVERAVKGWFRAIEITYSDKNGFHPHIHAILAVEHDYFNHSSGKYITQPEWVDRWQKALRVDYKPSVNIKKTSAKGSGRKPNKAVDAALEAAKYSVKDSEYLDYKRSDKENARIVAEYTQALMKRRVTAYGGWLKDFSNVPEDTDMRDDVYDLLELYNWSFGQGDYLLMERRKNPDYIGDVDDDDGDD